MPAEVIEPMRQYLRIIFAGLIATSVYNFFACMLRALGNSAVPLYFLAVSAVLNIGLDLLFIIGFHWGISGAAIATIIAQYTAGIGCLFLLYGYYRAVNHAEMSVVLTVISLGLRVA